MMKRVLSVVFAAALLVGLLAVIPVAANATSGMSISKVCVDNIKKMEGFNAIPYWDYGQWTVGFGTTCPSEHLTRYQKEGIPMDEADALMAEQLAKFESQVNSFIDRHGLEVTQGQFDALVSMTYNLGSALLYNENHRVTRAILDGVSENELIFAFSVYCAAGGEFLPGLIRRRLVEANMWLNGEYDDYAPENYCYVLYEANGGTRDVIAQGYDCNLPAQPLSVPTYEGYRFAGWFTAATGGTRVTVLDDSTDGMTLYAHWEKDESVPGDSTLPDGSLEVQVKASAVNVRSGAGMEFAIVDGVFQGEKLTVTGVAVVDGVRWGRFEKGWIPLRYTDYGRLTGDYDDAPDSNGGFDDIVLPVRATVLSASGVTLYNGPHTTYPKLGTLKEGTEIEITEVYTVFDTRWGKCAEGWVQMNLKLQLHDEHRLAHSFTATVNYSYLNVRSGPGTNYSRVDSLKDGTQVQIVSLVYVGDEPWGRFEKGWISLGYTDFDATLLDQYMVHHYGDWSVSVKPGCESTGEERRDCLYCDEFEVRSIPAAGHSYGTWYESAAGTCVTAGQERRDCQYCDAFETRESGLGEHSYGTWYVVHEGTCTQPGQERRDCAYCDAFETRETQSGGHSYGDWYETTAATCVKPGQQQRDCVYCDAFETRETELAEHAYDAWVEYLSSTCTVAGEERRTCPLCGNYESRELPLAEHSFGQWYETAKPTVDAAGEERRDCQNCDHFETRTLEPTEHIYDEWYVVTDATCTEPGEERRNCLHCDEVQSREIPARGHSMTDWVEITAPGCETEGQRSQKCQICGEVQTETVEATGHQYDEWIIFQAPSCTQAGKQGRVCLVCNYLQTESLPALNHQYSDWVVLAEATCTTDGERIRACSVCADVQKEKIPAAGHTFGQWYSVTDATCGQPGERRRDCTVCGYQESEKIEAADHSYGKWYVHMEASCGQPGEERRECMNCGYVESRPIAALEHSFGQWYVYKEAVCGVDGEARRECTQCGQYDSLPIPAQPHTFGDWSVHQPATCTEQGEERRVCTACGSYESNAIPATGHSLGQWYVAIKPTTTSEGQERRDCANCSHYESRTIDKLTATVTKVYGTVTDYYFLRIRAGAGTGYSQKGVLAYGQRVEILEQKDVGGVLWGRIGDGAWCCITDNMALETVKVAEGENYEVKITVYAEITYSSVRVRSGPGTGYGQVSSVKKGDVLQIQEIQVVDGIAWGRIDSGWVWLTDYAKMSHVREEETTHTHSYGQWYIYKEAACGVAGEARRDCTTCGQYESLRIPAIEHSYGDWKVYRAATCTEQGEERRVCTACGSYESNAIPATGHSLGQWYVTVEPTTTSEGQERRDCANCSHYESRTIDKLTATVTKVYGTVTEYYFVRIRAGAGKNYAQLGTLAYGQRVEILEQKDVGGVLWGRIGDGAWCCITDNMTLETVKVAEGEDYEVKITVYAEITYSSVRVRSGPGTGYGQVSSVKKGDVLQIQEIQVVDGIAWGRIDSGWVWLSDYAEMSLVCEDTTT